MVDGIEKLLMSSLNEPINIGNPREISMMELAKLILRITESSSGIVHQDLPVDDPKVRQPDITKAKKNLNWQPKVSLESGLQKTIDYFKTMITNRKS
jgi:dTDP-glucose 4,6-dehydratase